MIFEKQIVAGYEKQFGVRSDDTGVAYYFSSADFEGLHAAPYFFENGQGKTLKGYFYWYDTPKKGRLVVFDHGFGGGHRSYMREIERICREGYLVFSYDHTGCMESEGERTHGLGRSLCDLDACFGALKKEEALKDTAFSVIGHSWGGYSAMNISALHPEITNVVVLAGFVSVKRQIDCFFKGFPQGYKRAVLAYELAQNGRYAQFDGLETLKNTKARVLLVYSENDRLVRKKLHYDPLYAALKDRENVSFLLEKKKGHNPNYTEEAVARLADYMKLLQKKQKKKELATEEARRAFVSSQDFKGMTEQDESVWKRIFKALEE
jgi:pimeloyl-ACP methyl ester carboxylesterase